MTKVNSEQGEGGDIQLSPSETFAHNAAMRVAGNGKVEHSNKTQRALASIVLGFELFVFFLVGLTVFGLELLEPRELGIWGGLALCAVIIISLVTMRVGNIGLWIGWVVQALLLASGFILPMAFVVGALFTATWVYCMVKGSRIDRDRIKWVAAHEDAQGVTDARQ